MLKAAVDRAAVLKVHESEVVEVRMSENRLANSAD